MAQQSIAVREGAETLAVTPSLVHSIVPMAGIGVIIALAMLLLSIVLTSPATHGNLVP